MLQALVDQAKAIKRANADESKSDPPGLVDHAFAVNDYYQALTNLPPKFPENLIPGGPEWPQIVPERTTPASIAQDLANLAKAEQNLSSIVSARQTMSMQPPVVSTPVAATTAIPKPPPPPTTAIPKPPPPPSQPTPIATAATATATAVAVVNQPVATTEAARLAQIVVNQQAAAATAAMATQAPITVALPTGHIAAVLIRDTIRMQSLQHNAAPSASSISPTVLMTFATRGY
jgi:hypothetical protein